MKSAAEDLESDQSDFSTGVRWMRAWQAAFFSLYTIVFAASLALYFFLLKAVATTKSKRVRDSPVYYFLGVCAFTCVSEYGLVMQQFLLSVAASTAGSADGGGALTTPVCRLFTYWSYGNKILQAATVTALIAYTFVSLEVKRQSFEAAARRRFPFVVAALLAVEFVLAAIPASNVAGDGSFCYNLDTSWDVQRATGWIFLVVAPFLVPAAASAWPAAKVAMRIRSAELTDAQMSNAKVSVVTTVSFFFFHLLYYLLMIGRESEALILDRPAWRKMLGMHVWYITRPMFALIAFGWHVCVPLAPFAFDGDLMGMFPGTLINKSVSRAQEEDSRNSIAMSETPRSSNNSTMRSQSEEQQQPPTEAAGGASSEAAASRKIEIVSKEGVSSSLPSPSGRSFENPMQLDPNMNEEYESSSFA